MEEQASRPGGDAIGARCALHPLQPAVGVCARCGNYMCSQCNDGGAQTFCPPCQERAGMGPFPFNRERFDLGDVMTYAFERYKEQWAVPTLGVLVVWFVSFAFGMVDAVVQGGVNAVGPDLGSAAFALSMVINVASWVVQTGLQLGLWSINLGILQGKRPELGELVSQFPRLLYALAQVLVIAIPVGLLIGIPVGGMFLLGLQPEDSAAVAIGIGVAVVLLLPIAIYVALGLTFMQAELVFDPDTGPLEAMGRSWRIASGKRLWLLVAGLALLALAFAGLLACCVGLIPATALGGVIMAAVYLALRNGAEL